MMQTKTREHAMALTTSAIVRESVGSLLRSAREELGLSVHSVSLKTKIPEKYLALFEADAHDNLQDDVYTKIYLKAYAKFLGFEVSDLLDHYNKERMRLGISVHAPERPDRHPTTEVESGAMVVAPRLLQYAALALVAVGLVAFFGYEVKRIIAPPDIALASPRDGLITYDRAIAVEGATEREVTLRVNGKEIALDDTGRFRDTVNLQEGVNVISVIGAKKHSKSMAVERRVIVLPRTDSAVTGGGDVQVLEVGADGTVKELAPVAPDEAMTLPTPAASAPAQRPAAAQPAATTTQQSPALTTPAETTPAPTNNAPAETPAAASEIDAYKPFAR